MRRILFLISLILILLIAYVFFNIFFDAHPAQIDKYKQLHCMTIFWIVIGFGIGEELIFRKSLKFWIKSKRWKFMFINTVQAILYGSFLFIIFGKDIYIGSFGIIFGYLQGVAYKAYQQITYPILVHFVIDLGLYLSVIKSLTYFS